MLAAYDAGTLIERLWKSMFKRYNQFFLGGALGVNDVNDFEVKQTGGREEETGGTVVKHWSKIDQSPFDAAVYWCSRVLVVRKKRRVGLGSEYSKESDAKVRL